jgi:hypothetical protein
LKTKEKKLEEYARKNYEREKNKRGRNMKMRAREEKVYNELK